MQGGGVPSENSLYCGTLLILTSISIIYSIIREHYRSLCVIIEVSNTRTEVHPSVRHYRSLCVIIEVSNTGKEVHLSVRHYQSLCVIIEASNTGTEVHPSVRHY